MRINRWMAMFLSVIFFVLVLPGVVLAETGGEWAEPYVREMLRLRFLEENTELDFSAEISRKDFFAMLSNYVEELRTEEAKALGEQKRRAHIDEWIQEQAGQDWPLSRIEALRALKRVEERELSEKEGDDPLYLDCERLPLEDRMLIEYYQKANRIHGYPDGTFRPDEPLSLGEAACLFYQSLYADEKERTMNSLQAVKLESLVDMDSFDLPSQWAWSVCPRPLGKQVNLHDGMYPVDLGRFRILAPPALYRSESGRDWIYLEMEYARHCPKGFDVYLICDGGRRFLKRSNFEEFFQIQEGKASIYYPLVSKYDSFTLDDIGELDYHFEDFSWASYDGRDIESLLIYDPLFGIWLALPFSLDSAA